MAVTKDSHIMKVEELMRAADDKTERILEHLKTASLGLTKKAVLTLNSEAINEALHLLERIGKIESVLLGTE